MRRLILILGTVATLLSGCAANDPQRLCDASEFSEGQFSDRQRYSLPPYEVTLRIEGWPTRALVVGDTMTVTAISSSYDRDGACQLDSNQLNYQWTFSPSSAVVPESVVTRAHGSMISFGLTSSALKRVTVDVSHPQWGAATERTDPFPIYTPEQAQINQLMNELDRVYKYNELATPNSAPDQLRLLQSRLGLVMEAIYANDPKQAAMQLEAFRDEVATMRAADEVWSPVLLETETILQRIRALPVPAPN